MKIRQGFVSNSSSSSFVVVLPIGFDPYEFDYSELDEYKNYQRYDNDKISNKKVAVQMEKLINDEVTYDYDSDIGYLDVVNGALKRVGFKFPSFETGPDGGGTAVVKGEDIMSFLSNGKNYCCPPPPLEDSEIQQIINDNGGPSFIIKDEFENR